VSLPAGSRTRAHADPPTVHRLTALGLLEARWADGRRHYRLSQFGRQSVIHARMGARVFGRRPVRRDDHHK